jgi:hypothetical protein
VFGALRWQLALVKEMLREQHGLDPATITDVDFFGGQFKKYQ